MPGLQLKQNSKKQEDQGVLFWFFSLENETSKIFLNSEYQKKSYKLFYDKNICIK